MLSRGLRPREKAMEIGQLENNPQEGKEQSMWTSGNSVPGKAQQVQRH